MTTKTLEEELKEAFDQQKEVTQNDDTQQATTEEGTETVEETTETRARGEDGKFLPKTEEVPETPKQEQKDDKSFDVVNQQKQETQDPSLEPPVSLSGAIKQKWKDLPADVRAEWSKRENDIHQMMTRHDGELRMGREMKEVISPYIPIIAAEGGTPSKAVAELLNTAYQLRNAQPMQKAALVEQIIQTYGVDMSLLQNQSHQEQNPEISQLRQHIARLEQMANPVAIQNQLQEKIEHDRVMSEVTAFSNDPANKYYHQVKAEMAALLGDNRARDIKEAYDMACWAKPEIRSTLLAEQKTAEETKRKSEIEAKRKAASSLAGSPAPHQGNSTAKKQSLEDELREQLRAARGQQI